MTIAFYRQLAQTLQIGSVVLATVIEVKGSVPREVGAKLFVAADGEIGGTIGGGAGEAKIIHHAKTILATGEKRQVEIDLTGMPHRDTQGICGGTMQVWLERWQPETIALVQQILTSLESGHSVTLITPLEPTRSPHLKAQSRHEGAPPLPRFPPPPSFIETLAPPPTLLIVGAGHCGIQLAKIADLIGFQILVQDDRPAWANERNYPQATRIFTDSIATVLPHLANHAQLYAALLTRGYEYDRAALLALLQRQPPCCYIGMIGSKKRVHQVFQAVQATGISATQLQTIHAPIGLDIGALTPAEIAVSISAELILVRRGGTGHSHIPQTGSNGLRGQNVVATKDF